MTVAHAEVSHDNEHAHRFHLEIDAGFMTSTVEEQRKLAAAALRGAKWRENLAHVVETSDATDGHIGTSIRHPHVVARDHYIDLEQSA